MNDNNIYDKLIDVLSSILIDVDFENDKALEFTIGKTTGWDSTAHLRIVMEVEDAFTINLTPDEIFSIKTVNDLLTIIEDKLAE